MFGNKIYAKSVVVGHEKEQISKSKGAKPKIFNSNNSNRNRKNSRGGQNGYNHKCALCDGHHRTKMCLKFATVSARINIAKAAGKCVTCCKRHENRDTANRE